MNNNISVQPKRLMAVDILRGMTVMLMIMVNNGAGKEIFVTLQHSKWNGMTPCDLVFPFFLFIMGFLDILEFKEVELHMVGGNSKEDCQANNLAVCDWLADKLARHGFVGQSH